MPGGLFGGIEQAIVGLAGALSRLEDGDEEYLFLAHPDHDGWIAPHLGGRCRILHTRMEFPGQAGLPRLLRGLRERLPPNGLERAVISSDGTAERAGVEVVHLPIQEAFLTEIPTLYEPRDLQHLHLPDLFSDRSRARREIVYRTHCEAAEAVVAMASWGRRDLIEQYGLAPERVSVVTLGSVFSGEPEPSEDELGRLRSRLSLPDRFLLYPAQTWPHKNHERLLEALALLRDRDGIEASLVCPGRRERDQFRRIETRMEELDLGGAVSFPGFVSNADLRGLYRLATALVFPSRFEGWGLPVTEAFAEGLPVAASRATCLPDVVGDAGLLFDADRPEQIADCIRRLWTEDELLASLAVRGRERAELFSFDRAARLYRAHHRRIAGRDLTEEDRKLLASPSPA